MPSSTDPEQGVGGLHVAPSGNASLLSERVLKEQPEFMEKNSKTAQHRQRKHGVLRVTTSADVRRARTASTPPVQQGCGIAGRSLTLV